MQDLIPTDPETIKEMAKAANQYFSEIAKSPLQEFGGLIADKVKYWRASLQLKQLEKLTKKIKEAGFKPKKLEMKPLFSYLEGISVEEDEQMQNTWADLMMNYVDPEVSLNLTVYPDILKQLSTPEIQALECLYFNDDFALTVAEETKLPDTIEIEICANLERLGLLKEEIEDTRTFNVTYSGELTTSSLGIVGGGKFKITAFGKEFVKACTRA